MDATPVPQKALMLSRKVDECQPLILGRRRVLLSGGLPGYFSGNQRGAARVVAAVGVETRGGRIPRLPLLLHRRDGVQHIVRGAAGDVQHMAGVGAAGDGVGQGLTIVHFSAQLKRFLWDRGCVEGLFRGCLGVLGSV
jgi:hypothetical protein